MEKQRNDSLEGLLTMNGNTTLVENNNMGEKDTFHCLELDSKSEQPVKKFSKLCTPRRLAVVTTAIIAAAVILIIVTALLLHFKASKPDEAGPDSNKNSSSAFTSPPTISTVSSTTKSSSTKLSSTISSSTKSSTTSSTRSSTTSSTTSTTPSTITTLSTTAFPPCPLTDQFQCSDGRCIDSTLICDGKPNCPGAEDELRNCTCSSDQFRCSSGQCVAMGNRCDGSTQCYDRSDEMNCSDCRGFQCASGLCLWTMSVRCDGRVHCPDLSDEMNCGYNPRYLRCDNGIQLPEDYWCNGRDDCFDNSDEKDCAMSLECLNTYRLPCPDYKTCYVNTWKCDGYQDCPGGADESSCGTCSGDQFQCTDYSCLDRSQVCDGKIDCPSGNDEVDCLQLNQNGGPSVLSGVVTVMSHDVKLPVCSDNWDSKVADDICEYLGNGPSVKSDFFSVSDTGTTGYDDFVVLDPRTTEQSANQSVLVRFTKTSECSSKKVVSITCSLKGCGERQIDIMTSYVVGGVISPPGKWPWMVSLSMLGRNVCGGVVINQRWVLTAAHCIVTDTANYTQTPHYFEVTVGTNSRTRSTTDTAQRISVDKILIHPDASWLINKVLDWDLALIHLKEPIKFGDYVQPVCLPTSVDRFPTKSQCYLAGWGYINPDQVTVKDLREAKMTLWLDSECGSINHNSTICAGYHSGQISACQGDSGGPLMCQNAQDRWTVIGIMSNGPDSCSGSTKRQASKFAEVLTSIDWIDSSLTSTSTNR